MSLQDGCWITPAAGATPLPKDKRNKGLEMTFMKNWKKIVAMLLAGVMALAMLTACGGVEMYDETEDLATEAKVRSAMQEKYSEYNFEYDGTLKKLAWDALGKINVETGKVNKDFKLDISKDGIAIVRIMADTSVVGGDDSVNIDSSTVIESGKLAEWMEANNLFKDNVLNLKVGDWVKVEVAAKKVDGKIYVAVAVGVNWGK